MTPADRTIPKRLSPEVAAHIEGLVKRILHPSEEESLRGVMERDIVLELSDSLRRYADTLPT